MVVSRWRVLRLTLPTLHVYGQDFPHDSNTIEVLIARLRKKLGSDFIRTRRGHGYIVGAIEP